MPDQTLHYEVTEDPWQIILDTNNADRGLVSDIFAPETINNRTTSYMRKKIYFLGALQLQIYRISGDIPRCKQNMQKNFTNEQYGIS